MNWDYKISSKNFNFNKKKRGEQFIFQNNV